MRKPAFVMKVSGHRSGKQRRASLGRCGADDECSCWGWEGFLAHLCPEGMSPALADNQGSFCVCCRDRLSTYWKTLPGVLAAWPGLKLNSTGIAKQILGFVCGFGFWLLFFSLVETLFWISQLSCPFLPCTPWSFKSFVTGAINWLETSEFLWGNKVTLTLYVQASTERGRMWLRAQWSEHKTGKCEQKKFPFCISVQFRKRELCFYMHYE